ncbi:hypothetical protein IQ225_13690 [Synechocystis salina LEGE 06155]|nr:hypothetical protein [Synechocystis salina LEGE 06155]
MAEGHPVNKAQDTPDAIAGVTEKPTPYACISDRSMSPLPVDIDLKMGCLCPAACCAWFIHSYPSTCIGIKFLLLLGTVALAIHPRFFTIPNLTGKTLNDLPFHIIGVIFLATLFVIIGAGIRLGGLA